MYEELAAVANAAKSAGHGGKTAVYREAADRLGVSIPTLLTRLKQVRVSKPRKRRSDAGACALTRDEALLIAATVEETRRLTGTGELPLEDAVSMLRASGKILAGRVDAGTGEFTPLSVSAIRRSLVQFHCHPGQLAAPTPASRLRSPHPNYCWQIDASVSRQYFLADDGAQVMDRRVYYRGKPGNFAKINDRRLWRYVVTDHASGYIEAFYVQGAESAANLLSALIYVMTERAGSPMYGSPKYLMADPGSAVTAGTTRSFLDAMCIELIVNEVGNARAKGQVENAQYVVETHFEAALKLQKPVASLAEINALAAKWCRAYNATTIHSRTGTTRQAAYLTIGERQLAPPVEVLRTLATTAPVARKVRDYRIKHDGALWDVSGLPGVLNDSTLDVVINALDPTTLRVLVTGDDGRPAHYLAPRIEFGAYGFEANAAIIGAEFKAQPETPVDAARKELDRLAMDVKTDAEAAAARKAKRRAFADSIDPTKPWRDAKVPEALPRAGTPSTVQAPAIVEPSPTIPSIRPQYAPALLSHAEMARGLKRRVEARGGAWNADLYARMTVLWPDGVPDEQLDDCAVALMRGGLRALAGGAA
jgi:hypothetical protein